jgi:hypothetical protein
MNPGIVIAGKTADRFHGFNNVAEEKGAFHTSQAFAGLLSRNRSRLEA